MRARSTAIGITPVGAKPERLAAPGGCSRSRRARDRRGRRASPAPAGRATRAGTGWRRSGAKKCAGVMLWYCRTRAPGSVANAAVIGDGQREMEDRDVARARGRRRSNGRTSPRRSSSIVIAKRSDACPWPRSRSRTRRALSPIASPLCAAGTHWLMTIARQAEGSGRSAGRESGRIAPGLLPGPAGSCRLGERAVGRRPELVQLLEPLAEIELIPEVEGDWRRRLRRQRRHLARRSRAPGRRSRARAAAPAPRPATRARSRRPRRSTATRVDQRGHAAPDPSPCRARRRRPSSPAPPSRRRRPPAGARGTPRSAARRSPRARSRRGTDRRRRRAPRALRCVTWPRKWTSRAPRSAISRCSIAK